MSTTSANPPQAINENLGASPIRAAATDATTPPPELPPPPVAPPAIAIEDMDIPEVKRQALIAEREANALLAITWRAEELRGETEAAAAEAAEAETANVATETANTMVPLLTKIRTLERDGQLHFDAALTAVTRAEALAETFVRQQEADKARQDEEARRRAAEEAQRQREEALPRTLRSPRPQGRGNANERGGRPSKS